MPVSAPLITKCTVTEVYYLKAMVLCTREILVLTGRSDTPKKASKRYFQTGSFIFKFYQHLPWTDEGHRLFSRVNGYHLGAASSQRLLTRAERRLRAKEVLDNLPMEDKPSPDRLDAILFQNLELLKQTMFKDVQFPIFDKYSRSEIAFSQMDMTMVQAAFIGSVVVFPRHFGATNATEEELQGYHYLKVVHSEQNLSRLYCLQLIFNS